MAKGGYRPGAGRPRGSKTVAGTEDIAAEARAAGMTPLEYMLSVMNDRKADKARRDRMAIAAAPFVHGKPGEPGKKEQRQEAAEQAAKKFAPPAPPKLVVSNA